MIGSIQTGNSPLVLRMAPAGALTREGEARESTGAKTESARPASVSTAAWQPGSSSGLLAASLGLLFHADASVPATDLEAHRLRVRDNLPVGRADTAPVPARGLIASDHAMLEALSGGYRYMAFEDGSTGWFDANGQAPPDALAGRFKGLMQIAGQIETDRTFGGRTERLDSAWLQQLIARWDASSQALPDTLRADLDAWLRDDQARSVSAAPAPSSA